MKNIVQDTANVQCTLRTDFERERGAWRLQIRSLSRNHNELKYCFDQLKDYFTLRNDYDVLLSAITTLAGSPKCSVLRRARDRLNDITTHRRRYNHHADYQADDSTGPRLPSAHAVIDAEYNDELSGASAGLDW